MSQIGKGMILYADQAGNGEVFPTLSKTFDPNDVSGDAQQALTLLYKNYINDVRVFSCPSKPMSMDVMKSVVPSSVDGWEKSSFSQAVPGVQGRSTSYGHSTGHRQEDGQAIVLGDRQGTSWNGNSDNHGIGKGQNCLAAAGNVEFRDSKINKFGKDEADGTQLLDADIYSGNSVFPTTRVDMETFLR